MKYIEIRNTSSQKLSTLGVLSAFALAPFFAASEAVQADPPAHAPAHGYYKNKGKGKRGRESRPQPNGRRDYDGDGDYDADDRNTEYSPVNAGNITLNGTVTRDLRGGDRFQVRADNGRTYEVVSHNREPLRLSSGDRVQLSGHVDDDLFIADSVRIVDNVGGGAYNNQNITVNGTVTRDLRGGDRFQVRGDNGRIYEVVSHNREPLRLSSGDRVQLSGHVDRDLFIADSVRIVTDRNGGNNRPGGYGRGGGYNGGNNGSYNNGGVNQGDLSGVVTRDLGKDRFEIRADNGQTYTVRTRQSEPIRLTGGDRVVLRGKFGPSGLFVADSVRITRNDDRTANGSRVNFSGTVISVQSSTRLVVRGDNGRTYPVRTSNSNEFKRGDQVQVVGTAQRGSGIVIASSVTRR